jgi:hypothetical protein
MPTTITPRTKPVSTAFTGRQKPQICLLWTNQVMPWELDLPWEYNTFVDLTAMTPRTKP